VDERLLLTAIDGLQGLANARSFPRPNSGCLSS
jgi:hypothetical protein